jgi:hypothetical protein
MWRLHEQDRRVEELEARMASDDLFYGMVASRAADPFASPLATGRRRLEADMDADMDAGMDMDASAAFTTPPSRRSLAPTAAASAGASASAFSFPWRPRGNAEVLAEAARPPDVVLHVGDCAFALHTRVLRHRGRGLYKKILLLRDGAPADLIDTDVVSLQQTFQLRMLSSGEDEDADDGAAVAAAMAGAGACPLADLEVHESKEEDGVVPTWLYTRCASHWDANRKLHQQPSPPKLLDRGGAASPRVKTEAVDMDQDAAFFSPPRQTGKRKRRADSSEYQQLAVAAAVGVRRRGVVHVKLLGTRSECVATCIEYIYTKKIRFVSESDAEQTAWLCEWLSLTSSIYYRCLRLAAARVTPRNWMALVRSSAMLDHPSKRYVLIHQLADYLPTLGRDQYMEFAEHSSMADICVIRDRATLITVVVALIDHVRMLNVWWDLFYALDAWLFQRGPQSESPLSPSPLGTKSLLALSHHFAPWEPVRTIPKFEFFHEDKVSPTIATLVDFGEFALQVRFEHGGSVPILWRVIKMNSPKFVSGEPLELESQAQDLKCDPKFCIRGQLKVKYQRPNQLEYVVKDEVSIEYQHCVREYGTWRPLVSSMSKSGKLVNATDEWWSGQIDDDSESGSPPLRKTVAKMYGTVFVWGDTLCNLYHYLLVSSLFYSPPPETPRDEADDLIIDEMQNLPFETLVLVLLSDRLRIPGGETTLVRLLTKMVFTRPGNAGEGQPWRGYNGRAHEVVALFRCVRWCFVNLRQILSTLAKSPRRLRLYELIQDGLRHTHLRFRRRTPWGWQSDQEAYASNTTNVVDFEIEAGDKSLSPSQFEVEDTEAEDVDAFDGSDGGDRGESPVPLFPPLLPGVR